MRNFKITLEYDGSRYFGWQVQRHTSRTIQAALEKTLRKILNQKVTVIGSGRTDSGVHALSQVANFKTDSALPPEKVQAGLNALLPQDIVVTGIKEVSSDFNAIRDVKSKVYRYSILNRSYASALLAGRVYFYHLSLNISLMRKEARCLAGRHDFRAFCAAGSGAKTTVRTIKKISIRKMPESAYLSPSLAKKKGNFLVVIDIEAEGFLYNMVRNIVGTLIEIGRGRFPKGSLKRILISKNRKLAGPTVPARGLCLLEVKY